MLLSFVAVYLKAFYIPIPHCLLFVKISAKSLQLLAAVAGRTQTQTEVSLVLREAPIFYVIEKKKTLKCIRGTGCHLPGQRPVRNALR